MFHLRPLPENESHSERQIRDAVSGRGTAGKVHPALGARSGMQFPFEGRFGNGIPLWSQIPGRSFRLRGVPESASHSERQFRITVSADTRRQSAALITCLQTCDPETQNSRWNALFQKVHVPKLTKTSYPATVHGRRLPPTDSNKKYVAKSRSSTCMVRFWSAFGQLSGKFQLIRFCYPKGGGSS